MGANIGAELTALPLEYMLASPLTAVIKAQALAAKTTIDFIESVGLEEDGTTLKVRSVDFSYTQPVADPNTPGSTLFNTATLTVPLLSIVPIPYIRVSDLNVRFTFKIRDTMSLSTKSEITGTAGFSSETTASGKFGGGLVGGLLGSPSGQLEQKTTVTMDVSASHERTRKSSTDRTAEFSMTMNAVQDEIPEGLARVLGILNDTISAQKVSSGG